MKKIYIFLFAISLLYSAKAQWVQKTSMYNYGRRSAFGCSLNGYGYVGLGTIYTLEHADDVWEYNPTTGNWTEKAKYPAGGRNGATSYAANGKIYVFFGIDNSSVPHNDVWEYTPGTNIWRQKSSLPAQGRYNAEGFTIGDSVIYIGTGSYNSPYDYLTDFWKYSPKTNTWHQVASYPGGKRMCGASFAINNTGYLGTGLFDSSTPMKDFWSYNPQNDKWTRIPDYPGTARVGCVSFVVKDEGYVGTGDDYTNLKRDFYKYNPAVSKWVPVATPPTQPGNGGIAFAIDSIGYFGTGWNKNDYFTYLWAYNPNYSNWISENSNLIDLKIYPNPVKDYLYIETSKTETILSITNALGKELIKQQIKDLNTQLNFKNLPPGIYFVKLYENNYSVVKKIIKE